MPDPIGALRGLLPGATPPADGVYPRIIVLPTVVVLGAISGFSPSSLPAQAPAGALPSAPALVVSGVPQGSLHNGTPKHAENRGPSVISPR